MTEIPNDHQDKVYLAKTPSYDISAYNTVEKEIMSLDYTLTNFGKMYRISETSVLFEEKKSD